MSGVLQRVTTEFDAEQDRIRMAGATEDGRSVVVWLSRRLLGLLLPALVQHVDQQYAGVPSEHRDLMQEFAQQAAAGALGGSEPVLAAQDDVSLLATTVDLAPMADGGLLLTFRDGPGGGYRLPLGAQALLQWLHILYQAEQKADWRLPQWPAWLSGAGDAAAGSSLH